LSAERLPSGDSEFRVVDARSTVLPPQVTDAIKEVLGEYSEPDLATAILRESPTLARAITFRQQLQMRRDSLEIFRERLQAGDADEGFWQTFFQQEQWILGFGAVHQFLTPVATKPAVSPPGVSGAGGQYGDYMMATAAVNRFTVLVEIKKPSTDLLHGTFYRTGVFHASRELSGAVAQVQTQIHEFENSARADKNVRHLEGEQGIYTFRPRAVLVIGNTAQLQQFEQRRSFELYRRQIASPDIVTYDELLYRAELMLNSTAGSPDVV